MSEKRAQKASKTEALDHLRNMLGDQAVVVVEKVEEFSAENLPDKARATLEAFDETLGGMGIYRIPVGIKPAGIYRSFGYVKGLFGKQGVEDHTRFIIQASIGYLEELLKKVVRIWPWDIIQNGDYIPLGKLVNKARRQLTEKLYADFSWMSSAIGNFAKHHYNMENDEESQPDHYFSVAEAAAVYLMARKLGLQLQAHCRIKEETLTQG